MSKSDRLRFPTGLGPTRRQRDEEKLRKLKPLSEEAQRLRLPSKPEELVEALQDRPITDTERLEWWFSNESRPVDMNGFIRGAQEGWTANQWRSWIDQQMREARDE